MLSRKEHRGSTLVRGACLFPSFPWCDEHNSENKYMALRELAVFLYIFPILQYVEGELKRHPSSPICMSSVVDEHRVAFWDS